MINNEFYNDLSDGWYSDENHPVALLRAENRARIPWIQKEIERRIGEKKEILDIGCGAGMLANELQLAGHHLTGVDISASSLEIAKKRDSTKKVRYLEASGYALPFRDESFDVVVATDLLEHVERPEMVIREASRVLRKSGLFFMHTFNRNIVSYLLIIKGVEWFVNRAPKNMHVYKLFIRPKELKIMCRNESLVIDLFQGLVPDPTNRAFWKMLYSGRVQEEFRFRFVKNLLTGYLAVAVKI
jgi:2-polyprenyl-6-hydroxyphenyl methylase / 3-demethylubiquinone-9 3-methyltransferase